MAGYAFGMSLYGLGQRAGTIAFQSLVIAQLLHALSCRSERRTLMNGSAAQSNQYLTVALGGSLALQALTIIVPGLRRFLGLTPLGLLDAAVSVGAAIASLSVNELLKIQAR
jgi:Ca2+-transporting ATPase